MADDAIVIDGLTKRFGPVLAVDALRMRVPRGSVYGFLGPNGSGKTTTLGMLTGLIPPDAGSARIDGGFGALVEEPAFYPYLTGRQNLRAIARLMEASPERADETLAHVGLGGAADQRYHGYSQGMRRRLGLAAAMVADPAVLILDEPTNGLDPAGQREVRQVLRDYAARGRTVLLSSHILPEVQEACTHATILRKGRAVAQGTMADLLAAQQRIRIEVDDITKAQAVLRGRWASEPHEGILLVKAPSGSAAEVNRALVEAGLAVSALSRGGALEELFFARTEEGA